MNAHLLSAPSSRWLFALTFTFVLSACHEPVLSARPEDEANTALSTLSRAGVGGRKVDGGRGVFHVVVSGRDLDRALEILSVAGLPRASEPGLAELFPEPGLVSSPTEERARYHLALAGELGSSLRRLSGVREARVHLGLSPDRSRRLDRTPQEPAKASVLLLVEPGETQSLEGRADAVRELVAGAVAGLEAASVSVVVSEAKALPLSIPVPRAAIRPAMLATGVGTLLAGLGLACFFVIRGRGARKETER